MVCLSVCVHTQIVPINRNREKVHINSNQPKHIHSNYSGVFYSFYLPVYKEVEKQELSYIMHCFRQFWNCFWVYPPFLELIFYGIHFYKSSLWVKRYNKILTELKFTIVNKISYIKMYNSVVFNTFTVLFKHSLFGSKTI